MRCLTKASTTNKTKTASPLLRFRFCPEFLIRGRAHTKNHCSHNKALGCHVHVDQVNILVLPQLFHLYNPYATIAAKPAVPVGTNGASLAFRISLDPWSSSYDERETSVSLDIVIEESSDNDKMSQAPTGFSLDYFKKALLSPWFSEAASNRKPSLNCFNNKENIVSLPS